MDEDNNKPTVENTEDTQQPKDENTKKDETISAGSFAQEFFEHYEKYKEKSLTQRRIKNRDIVPLLDSLSFVPGFDVKTIGQSVENRKIFQVKTGRGATNVLLWSQMHGDESTGTMAMFDLFNFFRKKDEFDPVKKIILDSVTLFFVPMLNPDGAEFFKRRNALGIDLNRDALRRQSPEAKLLHAVTEKRDFDFAFNLHDQDKGYHVDFRPAVVSMVTPAYNSNKTVNKVRQNSMQLVVSLNNILQEFVPGHVGRYTDDHNPNCFGDDFTKEGISTVLFESGHFVNDPEKQFVRKLNFVALLSALLNIAMKSYEDEDLKEYRNIQEIEKGLQDLIIRNVTVETKGKSYTLDLGVTHEEVNFPDYSGYYVRGVYNEIGDMSQARAYQELDAKDFKFVQGKVFPGIIKSIAELNENNILSLLDLGYTTVKAKRLPYGRDFSRLPVHLTLEANDTTNEIGIGKRANFVLQKNGRTHYAVVNGILFDIIHNT